MLAFLKAGLKPLNITRAINNSNSMVLMLEQESEQEQWQRHK
jgi:hypothetical protein